MKTKRIVLIGGPSSGKTTLIESLDKQGYFCMPEISREVIKQAQAEGIEQLFLEDPVLFSSKLLDGRLAQHKAAKESTETIIFYDRGLPDVTAYMKYIAVSYPDSFNTVCRKHTYDHIFLLPPWEAIHTNDDERYENFEQAKLITKFLKEEYELFGHSITEVPIGTVEERTKFIVNTLKLIS
ncbi:ATP-binding protein [Patiriisocius hiemis]|uniref:ATP-binding protein n=1 Tax=Patiriisocius hiemis TaxID=3075604 RepID=A0ABU2Y8P6_9FLAO|nr:ATP-binding protein [Constantimarinum sp. W242]MDT0554540.1 ATP-binding protein [Constantimarinum sp. W242]